jgi:hypothetical protein
MKKIAFLAVILLTTFQAFAQDGQGQGQRQRRSPEEMAKSNTEWMTKELNLNAKQKVAVDSINLVYAKAQVAAFQSSQNGDREKAREAREKLNTDKEKALTKVLSKDQLAKYKKRNEELRNRRGQGRGTGEGQRPPRNDN